MPRKTTEKKDRTSIIISAILHSVMIAGVVFWAWKSGNLERMGRKMLEWVRTDQKSSKKDEAKPIQQRTPPPKLPSINQGLEQQQSGGTRRAVAADAPPSAGESFFQDTRRQVSGPLTSGGGAAAAGSKGKAVMATAAPPVPKPIFASSTPSTIKQLFIERAKAKAVTESFGTEQISKSGVSDAGAIINKVSGASVSDGKFAIIRGLNDRYVSTTLNGAEIPSADPYRKSASLDLFPAQVIDKVVVSKTFTPDQPGTYTGGGINIVTRSFPEKSFFNFSMGGAYNTRATGNENYLTYSGSGLDWAGMDDGARAIPGELSLPSLTIPPPPFTSGTKTSSTYKQRIADAEQINVLTQIMGSTEFAPRKDAPPLNHNFSIAGGDTTRLFGMPFGMFAGLSYKHDYSFYENAVRRTYVPGGGPGEFDIRSDYLDSRAMAFVNWASVVNFGYQIHENHELGFNFLYNQNSEDIARQQVGVNSDDPGSTFYQNRIHFTERNLTSYQLKGKHSFPELAGIQLDWMGSLSQTTQDEPDVRFLNYASEGGDYIIGKASAPDPKNPTRYFRNLDENNHNMKLDLAIPFRQWTWSEGEMKIGVFDSLSKRTFVDREVYYQGDASFNGDPNSYLTSDNLGYSATTNASNGRINYIWNRYLQTRDSAYDGEFGVQAGYLMMDLPLVEQVHLIGGLRYETTDLGIYSRSYLANSMTGNSTNRSALRQNDMLPASGLVYALSTNMNLRFNFGQTVARPSFRELAGYRSYDPTLDVLLDGNPTLKMASIDNFDFRWEWFSRPGEIYSISLFYKTIQNAIERRFVTSDGEIVTFANRDNAKVYGIEFEARKSLDPLLRGFSVGGNLSLIQSDTPLTHDEFFAKESVFGKGNVKSQRALYDQSPYILNVDLSYDNPRIGSSASIIFNISGPRIAIASLNTEDIYEQPAPSLDYIMSQKLGRHTSIKFSVKNILDPPIERTYGQSSKRLFSSYNKGISFGLALSQEF